LVPKVTFSFLTVKSSDIGDRYHYLPVLDGIKRTSAVSKYSASP
jgi:hypothetical protein